MTTAWAAKTFAANKGIDYRAAMADHRIAWRWTVGGEWRNGQPYRGVVGAGFDVTCTCGWASRTGGAVRVRIEEAISDHRFEVVANAVRARDGHL